MKAIHPSLLTSLFAIMLCTSSCTMTSMANWFDTKQISTDYVYEHTIELTTVMPHETSLPDTLSQKNKKERKRTIPTGTKVKVLAISFDRKFDLSHEEWFTASVPCVIELADSTRLLCPLPEIIISRRLALKDNKKDSVTIEKIGVKGKEKKLVLYGRTSQNELKEYSYKELDMKILPKLPMTETFAGRYLSLNYLKKELTGKSFQEVEQILKPAQSVIKTGNDRIACYQHIGTTSSHESSFYRHTAIYFKNNKVAGIYGQEYESFLLGNLPGFLAISKWKPFMITAGNDYYIFPRFSFFNLYQLGGRQVREIVSGILLILFFGFLAFLPSWINRWVFFYIKPLPNFIVSWIGKLMVIFTFYVMTIGLCYDEDWTTSTSWA